MARAPERREQQARIPAPRRRGRPGPFLLAGLATALALLVAGVALLGDDVLLPRSPATTEPPRSEAPDEAPAPSAAPGPDGGATEAARTLANVADLPEPPLPRSLSDDGDDPDEAVAPPHTTLTRGDVLRALGAIDQRVLGCYGASGRGSVKLTVAASGHVLGAKIAGPMAGSRAGECVEAVAREATFRGSRREVTTVVWTLPMHVGGR